MNPVTKTILIVVGSMTGLFLFPIILVLLHDYIYAMIAVTTSVLCVLLFGYYAYKDLLVIVIRNKLEEDEIVARFNGDPEKIRFYKAFKKYFDGDVDLEGLKRWLINHPVKH